MSFAAGLRYLGVEAFGRRLHLASRHAGAVRARCVPPCVPSGDLAWATTRETACWNGSRTRVCFCLYGACDGLSPPAEAQMRRIGVCIHYPMHSMYSNPYSEHQYVLRRIPYTRTIWRRFSTPPPPPGRYLDLHFCARIYYISVGVGRRRRRPCVLTHLDNLLQLLLPYPQNHRA